MKKIGMIGGLAWPSTLEYYRLICQRVSDIHQRRGDVPPYGVPEMVIESVNIAHTRALRGVQGDEASWHHFDQVFRETLLRLKAAGADFGCIASNTPHMRLAAITDRLDFKVVSIIDAMASVAKQLAAKRVLILGTSVTMTSPVYAEVLNNAGIPTCPPLPMEVIAEIQHLIDTDFYTGRAVAARARFVAICRKYMQTPQTVIALACTELPLAFPDHLDEAVFVFEDLTFINTTVAHVEAIVSQVMTSESEI